MKTARWIAVAAALAACGGDATTETTDTETDTSGGDETEVTVVREGAEPEPGPRHDTDPQPRAVAEMAPTEGNTATGTVTFLQETDRVLVAVELSGLEPGSTHGFHVHETGDCSAPDGTSAGGHFAPDGHDHALPPGTPRHAGDMGNVTADDAGEVRAEMFFDTMSVGAGDDVVGRAVIVHADADDGGQPTGNAGARIACGVIQVAPEPEEDTPAMSSAAAPEGAPEGERRVP